MVQYIFTPWRSRHDLLALRSQFYPDHHHHPPPANPDPNSQNHQKSLAVARVATWMHRAPCPHLIESTALLTAAILADTPSAESYAVRAAYAAAFGRFVTGLLDSHQDRAKKVSMYGLAREVGLPAAFVELRHQVTHEALPSLVRLRGAARGALGWIWGFYWRGLEEEGDGKVEGGGEVGGDGEDVGYDGGRGECQEVVRECVEAEEEGERMRGVREAVEGFGEGEVLKCLDGIVEGARDAGMLRRALGLVRVVMEGERERAEERVEEEKGEEVRDVEMLRAEMGRAWEVLRGIEAPGGGKEGEGDGEVEMKVVLPSWSLYDEETWVPKPIGIV